MLDKAKEDESLEDWAKRNGIDMGDNSPEMVGYWCRVSGVKVDDEAIRRDFGRRSLSVAKAYWKQADEEIRAENDDLADRGYAP